MLATTDSVNSSFLNQEADPVIATPEAPVATPSPTAALTIKPALVVLTIISPESMMPMSLTPEIVEPSVILTETAPAIPVADVPPFAIATPPAPICCSVVFEALTVTAPESKAWKP